MMGIFTGPKEIYKLPPLCELKFQLTPKTLVVPRPVRSTVKKEGKKILY
jgi:hypothetical protein